MSAVEVNKTVNKVLVGLGVMLAVSLVLLFQPSFAQAPVRLVDRNSTGIVLGASGVAYNSGLVTTSVGGTTITSAPTKVKVLFCRNNSASPVTFSITDNAGVVYFPSNNINANEAFMLIGSDSGLTMNGVRVLPGTNSVFACQVEGAQ